MAYPQPTPLANLSLISAAIPKLSRDALAGLVEHLIDRLDCLDPDPDLEPNGDELDGNRVEDEFVVHVGPERLLGPGCPLADPDMAVDDEPCDEPYQDLEPEDYGGRVFVGHWNPSSFGGQRVSPG